MFDGRGERKNDCFSEPACRNAQGHAQGQAQVYELEERTNDHRVERRGKRTVRLRAVHPTAHAPKSPDVPYSVHWLQQMSKAAVMLDAQAIFASRSPIAIPASTAELCTTNNTTAWPLGKFLVASFE